MQDAFKMRSFMRQSDNLWRMQSRRLFYIMLFSTFP